MDGNLYENLIGAAPSGPDQKSVAAALRRRRQLGELGVLTGDQVLSSLGENMTGQADKMAAQLQQTRQQDTDNAQTERYQTGQLGHMGNVLEETKRNNDMDFYVGLLNALAAQERAERAGKDKDPPRLRQGDIKTLRENAGALGTINEMLNYAQTPGKNLGQVELAGVALPGARQTLNAASRMGWGTGETKETAMQWQNYKRFYELAQRNNLFGATLTPNEMKAWADANPSVAQTNEQIIEGLKIMSRIYEQQSQDFASGLEEEGYSGEAIGKYGNVRTKSNMIKRNPTVSKTIGGKTYEKRGADWFPVEPSAK